MLICLEEERWNKTPEEEEEGWYESVWERPRRRRGLFQASGGICLVIPPADDARWLSGWELDLSDGRLDCFIDTMRCRRTSGALFAFGRLPSAPRSLEFRLHNVCYNGHCVGLGHDRDVHFCSDFAERNATFGTRPDDVLQVKESVMNQLSGTKDGVKDDGCLVFNKALQKLHLIFIDPVHCFHLVDSRAHRVLLSSDYTMCLSVALVIVLD